MLFIIHNIQHSITSKEFYSHLFSINYQLPSCRSNLPPNLSATPLLRQVRVSPVCVFPECLLTLTKRAFAACLGNWDSGTLNDLTLSRSNQTRDRSSIASSCTLNAGTPVRPPPRCETVFCLERRLKSSTTIHGSGRSLLIAHFHPIVRATIDNQDNPSEQPFNWTVTTP